MASFLDFKNDSPLDMFRAKKKIGQNPSFCTPNVVEMGGLSKKNAEMYDFG